MSTPRASQTHLPAISYALEPTLSLADYTTILQTSTLCLRRPTEPSRLSTMLSNSNLIITARLKDSAPSNTPDSPDSTIVGLARCWSDSFTCYVADLAVSHEIQGRGVGRELMERVRKEVKGMATVLLLSAPGKEGFYGGIGMRRVGEGGNAFVFDREKKG